MTDVGRDARAQAFDSLVKHLQANPQVQNIDIMGLAGFCRNCLAKWLLAAYRRAGRWQYTYDQALAQVYGMGYDEYKREHQKKATEDQLARFKESSDMHAKHDKDLIGPPVVPPVAPLMSDVCCQNPDAADTCAQDMVSRVLSSVECTLIDGLQLRLGVLTVSDRAFAGEYADESGPEIVSCVSLFADGVVRRAGKKNAFVVSEPCTRLVPDEEERIIGALTELADNQGCNLIFTTGGTGLSKRDVTPEATLQVVQRQIRGLPELVRRETSKIEPLAALSRAVAGIRDSPKGSMRCLVINLPGRPKACREALAVLLPLLPHALSQVGS